MVKKVSVKKDKKKKPKTKVVTKSATKVKKPKVTVASKKTVEKEAPVKTKAVAKKVAKVSKFAVIELGGTQHKVVEGGKYDIKKLDAKPGLIVELEEVLLVVDGEKLQIGTPYIKGAVVKFEIVNHRKDKKIKTFKYKAKSRYRKRHGHRARLTVIEIKKIKI